MQLPKFKSLIVSGSSEVGRLVLEDIGKMQRLVRVFYSDFRASHMPASFPQSLEDIHLNPSGWFRDLPAGLKQRTSCRRRSSAIVSQCTSQSHGLSLFPQTALRG